MNAVKKKKGFLRNKILALVVVAALVAGAPTAKAYTLPVADVLNTVAHYLNEVNNYINLGLQYKFYYDMLVQGEYYGFLMSLLNDIGEAYPDSEVGEFSDSIDEARAAWLGLTGSYGDTKRMMNELFGGAVELPDAPRWGRIEYTDASAIRASKELGIFRSKRDERKEQMEEMQSKANGETGEVRLQQMVNANLGNIYGAIVDQSMMVATTAELLATQLEIERAEMYETEQVMLASGEGLYLFLEGAGGDGLQEIEIP